jgi:hypothetical protein
VPTLAGGVLVQIWAALVRRWKTSGDAGQGKIQLGWNSTQPGDLSRKAIRAEDLSITQAAFSGINWELMTALYQPGLPGAALLLAGVILLAGCNGHSVPGSPGVPEPMKVLENPQTGERARFFREIWYKAPSGYDAEDLMADWVTARKSEGFTHEISIEEDRPAWAATRARAKVR